MAIIPITNAYVIINGTDLSDHVQKIDTKDSRDKIEITAMGAVNKVYTKGLGDATATITFFNNWALGKIHATLQPLISSTSPFTIEVRPVNTGRAVTNPGYSMSALLFDYSFLSVSVGDAPTMDVEFTNASQAGVSYLTA